MDPISEDAVFEAVRAAVEAGEYTDRLRALRAQGLSRGASGLPRLPVATAGAVQAVEEATGSPLPPLLRRLFLEVANGGFGPGHAGILGAPGHHGPTHHGDWQDLLDVHRAFLTGPGPHQPRHLLWLHDWGCAIWSLVDCSSPEGVMWVSDQGLLLCHGISLTEWLAAWLQGRLRLPQLTQDVPPNIPGQLTLFNDLGASP